MIKVVGPRQHPPNNVPTRTYDGTPVVNTTSRGTWKGLSPFYIGPCPLYEDQGVSLNMENAWQYSKVYAQHVGPDGRPTPAYFEWARDGWSNQRAVRYPMGRGVKPEFSWWGEEHGQVSYVEARKLIYIPLYVRAVSRTADFHRLRALYRTAGSLVLWDFDGWTSGMTFKAKLNDPSRPLGHGHILAALLERLEKGSEDGGGPSKV